ncbi:hypothetical protein TrRE_jg12933 [Triparma retinervis]|uniref:Uncharacterized protein n=1 Tax=Triparma retinervis TaxID=2557542 RepID=A0A9W7DZZ6_9STRA|nr:hypothetical protein TrRE_jg12933 [Triparma retinervis]
MVNKQREMVNTLTRVRVAYDKRINPLPKQWEENGFLIIDNLLDEETEKEVSLDMSKNLKIDPSSPLATFNLGLRGRYLNLSSSSYSSVPKLVEFVVSTAKSLAAAANALDGETGRRGQEALDGTVQQNRAGFEVGSKGEWATVESGEGVAVELIYYVSSPSVRSSSKVRVGGVVVSVGPGNLAVMVDRGRGVKVERSGGGEREQGVVKVWMYKKEGTKDIGKDRSGNEGD